jgi:uracil-DNA glycosylase family 4
MPPTVPSSGPLTARVLWVGEAPGRDEVIHGKPFIGASGQLVRRTLQWAGVDVESDVRFTNAVRHNPGSFPTGLAGAKLLAQYAGELDREIAEMKHLKVIVACGGPAMTRLTGKRSKKDTGWGIERYHNFVFRVKDIPIHMEWGAGVKHRTYLPPDVIVIPVLHPAGIMRSKGRDEMLNFRRGVRKVKAFLDGTTSKIEFNEVFAPSVEVIDEARAQAEVDSLSKRDANPFRSPVYFDTEFHRETKQVYWCGFTFDGSTVYGVPWTVEYVPTITRILCGDEVQQAAHNIQADHEALQRSGTECWVGGQKRPLIWDTLIAHHALHPALGVGLDDAARYYIDDIPQWKDLETADPHYNALDVALGWRVMQEQLKEAASRPVDPLPEIHARMRLIPVCDAMQRRGMNVDVSVRRKMREETQAEVVELRRDVEVKVRPFWDVRLRGVRTKLLLAETAMQECLDAGQGVCEKHPKRNGLRKPPKNCEVCAEVYSEREAERAAYKSAQATRNRLRVEEARWSKGFEPRNNEHLRWMLYSPDALRLPVQYTGRGKNKRMTANRAAIDKLTSLGPLKVKRDSFAVVFLIKKIQHLEKAISTFIDVPLDERSVAHPPYKIQGTRTGRLAGGKDSDDKSDNTYAFNVLNIPREWRRMYTAPPNHVLVAADWRNVEGRLTAMFCKDPRYSRVLADELTGGPKVHSVNASIIYGIDPADAKNYAIDLSGQQRTAYDGGKRLTHAWSYGMKPLHMSRTFNITMAEAKRIDKALSEAYPRLVQWRQQLVDDVLGVWERKPGSRAMRCVREGRRFLANPFGWQLHFLGVDAAQANEVIAFLPQSSGAGMFTRCGPLLEERYPIFTGTYDSFVLVVPCTPNDVKEAIAFLTTTMERPWPELEGRTFPCEVSVGYNWGDANEGNPRGLKEVA